MTRWVDLRGDDLKDFLNNLLLIRDEHIEDDLRNHSEMYAEIAVMLAHKRAEYEQRKLELKILEANLGRELRESLAKVTEKAIEEAIGRSQDWQDKQMQVIETKEEVEVLYALVQAMESKKDMIVSYLSWMKERTKMSQAI
jgi:hypothetical protein